MSIRCNYLCKYGGYKCYENDDNDLSLMFPDCEDNSELEEELENLFSHYN